MKKLKLIDIQFGNLCNRFCWFCPHQKDFKPIEKKQMSEEIQLKTIEFLIYMKNKNLIDKNTVIDFNRFYEPLLYHKALSEFMEKVNKILYDDFTIIETNGDLLSEENKYLINYFKEVNINRYDDNEMKSRLFIFKHFGSIKNITKINNKQILNFHFNNSVMSLKYDKEKFLNINNLWKNRASSIETLTNKDVKKTFCDGIGLIVGVDYNGYVFPCADLHSSIPSQINLNCGNILIDSFETIFENILNFDIDNNQCCKYCNTVYNFHLKDKKRRK